MLIILLNKDWTRRWGIGDVAAEDWFRSKQRKHNIRNTRPHGNSKGSVYVLCETVDGQCSRLQLSFATAGNGESSRFSCELFAIKLDSLIVIMYCRWDPEDTYPEDTPMGFQDVGKSVFVACLDFQDLTIRQLARWICSAALELRRCIQDARGMMNVDELGSLFWTWSDSTCLSRILHEGVRQAGERQR